MDDHDPYKNVENVKLNWGYYAPFLLLFYVIIHLIGAI